MNTLDTDINGLRGDFYEGYHVPFIQNIDLKFIICFKIVRPCKYLRLEMSKYLVLQCVFQVFVESLLVMSVKIKNFNINKKLTFLAQYFFHSLL